MLLATLRVERRPGRFTMASTHDEVSLGDGVEALIKESEATTVICSVEAAHRQGWTVDFEAAWLTLAVHSSLEAVGLTAAVSAALAEADIPANVVAGFFHDHVMVPAERADEAVSGLAALADRHRTEAS